MTTIKRSKVRTRGLRDVVWEGPTVAATLYLGRNRGKEARNSKGFCAKEPKKYTQAALDTHVQGIRQLLLMDRGLTAKQAKANVGGSRVAQKGWFHGDPEASAAYTIFHDPSVPGEETLQKFQASMTRLAELAGGALCQDEVIVQFQSPEGNSSRGVKDSAAQRSVVPALKKQFRFR